MTFDLPVAPLIQTIIAGFVGWIFKRQEASHKRSADNAERLKVLETRFEDRMEEFKRFRDTLEVINSKMDKMLETIFENKVEAFKQAVHKQ